MFVFLLVYLYVVVLLFFGGAILITVVGVVASADIVVTNAMSFVISQNIQRTVNKCNLIETVQQNSAVGACQYCMQMYTFIKHDEWLLDDGKQL